MGNKQPKFMADLMIQGLSAGSEDGGSEMEKAAAEAGVGELFGNMTKEAQEELVSTIGWAGRAFGEQVAAALEPTVIKLAEIQAELHLDLEKAAAMSGSAVGGQVRGQRGGPGGIGVPKSQIHTKSQNAPNQANAMATDDARGDNVKHWDPQIQSAIEAQTVQGASFHGKGINSQGENTGAYVHGKAAGAREFLTGKGSPVAGAVRKGLRGIAAHGEQKAPGMMERMKNKLMGKKKPAFHSIATHGGSAVAGAVRKGIRAVAGHGEDKPSRFQKLKSRIMGKKASDLEQLGAEFQEDLLEGLTQDTEGQE